jgi:hypothetical protein
MRHSGSGVDVVTALVLSIERLVCHMQGRHRARGEKDWERGSVGRGFWRASPGEERAALTAWGRLAKLVDVEPGPIAMVAMVPARAQQPQPRLLRLTGVVHSASAGCR